MAEVFYKNGLKFSCKKCSHCCTKEPGYVYLSKMDLNKLLNFFSMKATDFVEKYCRWVPYYDGSEVLCLNEKENYDCIFWAKGCSCYEARPIQCSTYPFWTYLLESESEWNGECANCPGINNGKNHSFEEITSMRIQYEMNIPLTKRSFLEDFS